MHDIIKNEFLSGGLVLMLTGAAMAMLRQIPSQAYSWMKRQLTVSVVVSDRDPLFEWTKLWLDSQPYSRRARNVTCSLFREVDEDFSTDSRLLFAPAHGTHFFRHRNRLVWLEYSKPDPPANGSAVGATMSRETITLTLLGIDQSGIRKLVEEIRSFTAQAEQQRTRAYISTSGWWRRMPMFQARRLQTVELPQEDESRILSGIEQFLASRALYSERGIPYHLNLLFAGLPGTGKTSIASALCGHFGLHLHLLNIAGPGMNDERLVELMLSLPRRSMVLMEDVDAVIPERKSKPQPIQTPANGPSESEDSQGITLSGLLNCMDGLTAPDGAIIIMTTNHSELIDPALLRPGRVDMRVDFGPATHEQIERMCARLLPTRKLNGEADLMLKKGYTSAQVQAELLNIGGSAR